MIVFLPTTKERRDQCDELIKRMRESAGMDFFLVVYENNAGGIVKPIWELLRKFNNNERILIINDDMWPITENWLKLLNEKWEACQFDKEGLLMPDDTIQQGAVATIQFTTVGFLKEYCFPGYVHNYFDREMTERATEKQLYVYCPEIIIEHRHWCNGMARKDETYNNNLRACEDDRLLYEERKAKRLASN